MSDASRPAETPPGPDRAARLPRRRRAAAVSGLLPLLGLLVLMPPFIRVFAHDGRTLGAPSALIFLLAVWLALILGTRRLARRLARRDPDGP